VIDISVTTRFKITGSKRWEGESSYSSPFVVNSVRTRSGEVVATIDSDLPIIGGHWFCRAWNLSLVRQLAIPRCSAQER